MTIKDFISKFIDITEIFASVSEIINETVAKAIEMMDGNDDPFDDKYSEALKMARDVIELKELIEENPEYYVIFMSVLMLVLEEKIQDKQLAPDQQTELNNLLEQVNVFA